MSLPLATKNVAVSSPQASLTMADPSVFTQSTPQMNVSEGTPISVPQFISQTKQMTYGGFTDSTFKAIFQAPQDLYL